MTQAGYNYDSAVYYRARYYDPAIGRFISEDPIGFRGSGPNFYGYVKNDPTLLSDPSGLTSWTCKVWMGTYRTFPAASGMVAVCSSECIGGQSLVVTLGGVATGLSLGIPGSGTYSVFQLSDSMVLPSASSLTGTWSYNGAGVSWIAGGSISQLTLGSAESSLSLGWELGLDGGYSNLGGVSHIISTKSKSCCGK